MQKRFLAIWFPSLVTDWKTIRQPSLKGQPMVFTAKDHGRIIVTAANSAARQHNISSGTALADAKAIVSNLQVFDGITGIEQRLLAALCKWSIRFTPVAAVDLPDGLLLDISGCAHLWGGEAPYYNEIISRLRTAGYDARGAIADTIGAAWSQARYGKNGPIIPAGRLLEALLPLPAAALRLEYPVLARLQKLGLYKIGSFASMPRRALRRRFGEQLLLRLDQAFGRTAETLIPILQVDPYHERLASLEPIQTRKGIEIALEKLLQALCYRLEKDGKGLRIAILKAFRIDGHTEQIQIGTNRPSHNVTHLFNLFEDKLARIRPEQGIEVFTLEAGSVEEFQPGQQQLWAGGCNLNSTQLAELVDRLANKIGINAIRRYLPAQHYWPERSIKETSLLTEKPATEWPEDKPRPIGLLAKPEPIQVSAPIPDYPPMLFIYKEKHHYIKKADGPERVEREWWLDTGEHRDYYSVEDQEGKRYWIFRSGHYNIDKPPIWFIHGFFA